MRALLHIGMGKTGTTAIQTSLAASRAYLGANGVFYPRSAPPLNASNHQILVYGALRRELLTRDLTSAFPAEADIKAAYQAFLKQARRQIEKTGPRCVVVSAESLFRPVGPRRMANFRRLVGEAEIEIAAYVRRPSDRFASSLQQALKYSHRIRPPKAPSFRKTLEAYVAAFGEERVKVRLFAREALVGGDVVADFVATFLSDFGIEFAALKAPARKNETLSAESSAITRSFRLRFYREKDDVITSDSRGLIAELRAIDAAIGAPRPRLKPGMRDLVDYSNADPLWLRDRFGIEFADFDYQRLERGASPPAEGPPPALEALFDIDPAVGSEILAQLRRTPWAAESDERIAWIEALLTAPAPHAGG